MKKALMIAAAALMLTGCGTEVDTKNDKPAAAADEVTTSEESTEDSTETTAAAAEETAKVTEKSEEASKAESKAEKKTADPDSIDIACMDTVEVYQQIKLSDFMFDSNAKLLNGDDMLDTEELGEHEAALKFELDGAEGEKKVKYNVVDTTPPVMLLGDEMYVTTGAYFDPDDYLSFADNCDRHPTMSWEGEVDTETEGTYLITVYIDDASGNRLTKDVSVTVSGASVDPYYDDSYIYFSDFIDRYDAPGREFGIDVSRWQGDIDFEAVRDEGCEFAVIRMGYGEAGGADLDAYYYNNIEGAKAAGLKTSVYFYSMDTTKEGAKATAERIVEVLDGQKLDLPVAFDWEEFQNFQNYGMSIHDLSEIYEVFAEELENNGYEAMLYSSKNFLELFWENKKNRPVWVAHYVDETTYTGDWFMWQRCGTGRISGIDGAVDLNVLQRK